MSGKSFQPLFGLGALLPLDGLSVSAAGAYGLRKLRTAYAGNCIKVTTSAAGNATQDIGFVGNNLDTASLATFLGANTGTINTWYDQSGNARNFTQATLALQPVIYTSSAVVAQINSKPTISFTAASTQWLDGGTNSTNNLQPAASAETFFGVWRPTAAATAGNANDLSGVGSNNSAANGMMTGYDNTPRLATGMASLDATIATGAFPFTDMVMVRTTALTTGTALTLYRNGSGSTASGTWSNNQGNGQNMNISRNFRPTYFTGYMAELYWFASQLSQADSNVLANNAASNFALTWTNI